MPASPYVLYICAVGLPVCLCLGSGAFRLSWIPGVVSHFREVHIFALVLRYLLFLHLSGVSRLYAFLFLGVPAVRRAAVSCFVESELMHRFAYVAVYSEQGGTQ